jgi:hypothetical protein
MKVRSHVSLIEIWNRALVFHQANSCFLSPISCRLNPSSSLPTSTWAIHVIASTMASSSSSSVTSRELTNSRDHHFDWSIIVLKNGVHTVYNVELHSGMTGTTTMHAIRKAYQGTRPTIFWFYAHSLLEDAVISSVSCLPFRSFSQVCLFYLSESLTFSYQTQLSYSHFPPIHFLEHDSNFLCCTTCYTSSVYRAEPLIRLVHRQPRLRSAGLPPPRHPGIRPAAQGAHQSIPESVPPYWQRSSCSPRKSPVQFTGSNRRLLPRNLHSD